MSGQPRSGVVLRPGKGKIDHILTKLGFRARTRLAAWAHEEGRWPDGKIRSP